MKKAKQKLVSRQKLHVKSIKVLTASALLASLSFVLAFVAKSVFGTGPLRVTFESLPILFGGFLYGPALGALIAVVADLLSCLQAGMTPNPIVAVGAAAVGLLGGLCYRYLLRSLSCRARVFLSVFLAHLVGSILIKSLGLYVIFGPIVLIRIPIYLAIATAEAFLLHYLTAKESFMRQIGKVTGI